MKNMKKIDKMFLPFFVAITVCGLLCGCQGKTDPEVDPVITEIDFAKGADVSWLTQMEAEGAKFYNAQGTETECMALLKSLGMNSIRLRVWVNPTNGWNNKEDVLVKAKRAKALGLMIMIDFHYSDSWADPGKQNKPAAWANLDIEGLKTALALHTKEVLTLLKDNNIAPTWVQVGNETTDGMLWEDGRASKNMKNYAELNNAGYLAAKTVFPNTIVILHIDNGWDNARYRWLLDGIAQYSGNYDMIGMSLYPEANNWQTFNQQCIANINDLSARYNKDVIVCEVGMSWDEAAACKQFLSDLIEKSKTQTGGRCKGVLYWEPEGYVNWSHYTKCAFDNSGKPTIALDAFK